ncbi:MAG TPA: methylated-DNA--[protein]-cysteine S-methyltransferase [Acidimicrobiales bacterium]|nr:methylated-DNA--[protein]-cysteine S-methyltransferase [Acidimicrobiales bacterium]
MKTPISLRSPIGTLIIDGTDEALTLIALPMPGRSSAGLPRGEDASALPGPLRQAVIQLGQYFDGTRTEFDVPIKLSGTTFQCDVWRALGEIAYGKTVSYAELAVMVGRPRALRAVGQANGANPLPIVLPCHRVVASGGRIGGYGGGLPMKRALLALEGIGGFG